MGIYVYRMIHALQRITIFGHESDHSSTIFTSDEATSESHRRIA